MFSKLQLNTGGLARFRKPAIVLVIALIAAVIPSFGFILVSQFNMADHYRHEVELTQERRALILAVLAAHQDIETGQRGFLLTGQDEFLEPYRNGERNIENSTLQLRKLLADRPDSLRLLDEVVEFSSMKRSMARQKIDLYKAGYGLQAIQLVKQGDGRRTMDAIRDRLQKIMSFEVQWLRGVTRESRQAAMRLRLVSFALLAELLLLLGLSALYIARALRARRAALVRFEDASHRREAVLNSAMDAIFTLNPSGTIESMNSSAEKMFGYSEGELLRRDVGKLFDPPQPTGAIAKALRDMKLEAGRPGELRELEARRKSGKSFPSDVALSAMQLADGIRYVAVVRDISERKRVERLKSEFVSTVSHELRTPLTSISGALGLLAGGAAGDLGSKASNLIAIARNNAERLVRLINDILDIEKIESGRMRFENREVLLREIAAESIAANQAYADDYRVKISLAGDDDARVYADPDRLNQVLTNLLSNAVKFSPVGGTVEVMIEPGTFSHTISVRDHGSGIPHGFRSQIFGKFAQADASDSRQKGGTGLGLSIVREIVVRSGGTVWFDSEEGAGTIFHVQLPAFGQQPASIVAARRSILLVGADSTLADGVAAALGGQGFAIERAITIGHAQSRVAETDFTAVIVLQSDGDVTQVVDIRANETPVLTLRDIDDAGNCTSEEPVVVLDFKQRPPAVEALVEAIDKIATEGNRLPRVLHVDDDPDVLGVVAAALAGHAIVLSTQSVAAARALIKSAEVDLAILDLGLEDGSGTELLPDLANRDTGPVQSIIFSAQDCDSQTASAVAAHFVKTGTQISKLVEAVIHLAERRRAERREAA